MIYPILKDENHPDRHHVEPSVEQTKELRLRGENFAWRLSEEFLNREMAARPVTANDKQGSAGGEQPVQELVTLLRQQLEKSEQQLLVKDHQIQTLSELTQSLNERIREGNLLVNSLQQKLALPSGEQSAPKPKRTRTTRTPPTEKKPKRGLLSWFR